MHEKRLHAFSYKQTVFDVQHTGETILDRSLSCHQTRMFCISHDSHADEKRGAIVCIMSVLWIYRIAHAHI